MKFDSLYVNIESSLKNMHLDLCFYFPWVCTNIPMDSLILTLQISSICIYRFLVTTKRYEVSDFSETPPTIPISCEAVPFCFQRCTLYFLHMLFATAFPIQFSISFQDTIMVVINKASRLNI